MATTSTGTGAVGDLKNIMQSLLEQFKPGGEIEQTRFAEAEKEGQRLRANLAGSAISRGLGNAALGIPTQVHEAVTTAKRGISSELSGQYLGVLTNLLNLAVSEESRERDRQVSSAGQRTATGAANKRADEDRRTYEWQKALEADKQRIADIEAARRGIQGQQPQQPQQPNAAAFPALYQAGGYGQGSIYNNQDSIVSDDDLGAFGMQPTQPAQQTTQAPTVFGYGPMYGD